MSYCERNMNTVLAPKSIIEIKFLWANTSFSIVEGFKGLSEYL